jgi:hypothetical protein
MAIARIQLASWFGDIRAIGWTTSIGPLFVPVGTKLLLLTVHQNQANTGGKSGFGVGAAYLGIVSFSLVPGAEAGATFEGLPPNVQRVEVWQIVNPPSGTWIVTLQVNQGTQVAGSRDVIATVDAWTGLDADFQIGDVQVALGISGTSPSVAVAAKATDLVIDAAQGRQNVGMTTSPGQTLLYSLNYPASGGRSIRARQSSKPGAVSVVMTWGGPGGPPDGEWAQVVLVLQETSAKMVTPAPVTANFSVPPPAVTSRVVFVSARIPVDVGNRQRIQMEVRE